MNCDIDKESLCCRRCGSRVSSAIVRRNCIASGGLGDLVAAGLSAVGITKDRAQAVAQAVGLEDCGCAERQRRLNELGQKLGIGSPEQTRP